MSETLHDLQLPVAAGERTPPPAFTQLADCKRWLAGVSITNTTLAREQLLQQLECLYHHPLPAAERLAILDFLRGPLQFIHDEWLRPYLLQRPELPLSASHQNGFAIMQRLWQALGNGYLRVLQGYREQAAQVSQVNTGALGNDQQQQAALAATRALAAMRQLQLDHHYLGLIPSTDFWRRLHRVYFAAETLGVSQLGSDDKPGAASRYLEILLLAAARPHELSIRQLDQVAYWAQRWAAKVALLQQAPEDLRTLPLCVNLASETAASHNPPAASDTLRWLDLHSLRKTIKQRLVKLGEGVSPQELKLGKHCAQPACELLLRRVYQDWCKGGATQNAHAASPRACELLTRIEDIHLQLSGKPFKPPQQSIYLDKRAHDDLATFGRLTAQAETPAAAAEVLNEAWQMSALSVVELLLRRPLRQNGHPLSAGRLIALRQLHESAWQLARIGWIASDDASDSGALALLASARLLPGLPQAITVMRATDSPNKTEHARGFLLPAVAELEQATSLLLPSGWFRAEQLIEIKTERTQKVRLGKRLERGADFERCTYDPVA